RGARGVAVPDVGLRRVLLVMEAELVEVGDVDARREMPLVGRAAKERRGLLLVFRDDAARAEEEADRVLGLGAPELRRGLVAREACLQIARGAVALGELEELVRVAGGRELVDRRQARRGIAVARGGVLMRARHAPSPPRAVRRRGAA